MEQSKFFESQITEYDIVETTRPTRSSRAHVVEYKQQDVVELANLIIEVGHKKGASDIHIESRFEDKVYIRYRIDGQMIHHAVLSYSLREKIISRYKILSNMDISEKRKPQDGKMTITLDTIKEPIGIRLATFPTFGGLEDMVMRILPNEKPLPITDIGLHPQTSSQLISIINKPHGMIFVSGPTGSGKTTTLHSMLNHLNTPNRKIWTAEDPVEIVQDGLRQIQIQKNLGYANVLRSFLRGDPDVIMIGEIRDHDSANIGIEASLTGHLVLSTLHTNSAVETVDRVVNMGISPLTFADALIGALSQRLARKLCYNCKSSYTPSKEEIFSLMKVYCQDLVNSEAYLENPKSFLQELYKFWYKNYTNDSEIVFYEARGCSRCDNGYLGRIGIHELRPLH